MIKSEVDVPEEVTFTTVDVKPHLENREVFISLYGVDRRLERPVLNQIPNIKLQSFFKPGFLLQTDSSFYFLRSDQSFFAFAAAARPRFVCFFAAVHVL